MATASTSTQSSFFASIGKIASVYVKPGKPAADPMVTARAKFANVADAQIKLLKEGASKGYCFKKDGDGFVVILKNGPAILNKDTPAFKVASAAHAIKFFEQAKVASEAGEFNELFTASGRAARKAAKSAVKAAK